MKRILIVALLLGALAVAACGAEPTPTPTPETFESPLAPGLSNPASKFCEDQGYELEMREEAGGTAGYCLFPDGSECEEWAFYRGECGQERVKEEAGAGVPNPAAAFCEEQGFSYEIRTADDGSQAGYCIFPNGAECEEWAFYRGECTVPEDYP